MRRELGEQTGTRPSFPELIAAAQEMLDAIAAFRRNPSISFEYEYNTQDNPDKRCV